MIQKSLFLRMMSRTVIYRSERMSQEYCLWCQREVNDPVGGIVLWERLVCKSCRERGITLTFVTRDMFVLGGEQQFVLVSTHNHRESSHGIVVFPQSVARKVAIDIQYTGQFLSPPVDVEPEMVTWDYNLLLLGIYVFSTPSLVVKGEGGNVLVADLSAIRLKKPCSAGVVRFGPRDAPEIVGALLELGNNLSCVNNGV